MALRSAAAQAATLLRLRGRPAVTESLWVPLARRFSSTPSASARVPAGLHYSDSHEWVKVEGDIGTIGLTDHAQINLGEVVFIELPATESSVAANDSFGTVESVKAVSELFSPVSGKVVEINEELTESPELVNQDAYGEGWLMKVKLSDKAEIKNLMTPEKYTEFQNAEAEH